MMPGQHHFRVQPMPVFCISARSAESAQQGTVLTPGRYVGAEDAEDDGMTIEVRIAELATQLEEELGKAAVLSNLIKENFGLVVAPNE